jgi:hypothetical protein
MLTVPNNLLWWIDFEFITHSVLKNILILFYDNGALNNKDCKNQPCVPLSEKAVYNK